MTEERQRQLSSLMDGELDLHHSATLYDLVARDRELRGAWERYHLIGQALRGERIDPTVRATADAVRDRLAGEPSTRLSPRHARGRGSRFAPFAGAALAAGLALVAVLAVPVLMEEGVSPAGPGSARIAEGAEVVPVAPEIRRWQLDRPELESKLDLFLVTHQEAAPATGVKGMLPYATLVGYEARR